MVEPHMPEGKAMHAGPKEEAPPARNQSGTPILVILMQLEFPVTAFRSCIAKFLNHEVVKYKAELSPISQWSC